MLSDAIRRRLDLLNRDRIDPAVGLPPTSTAADGVANDRTGTTSAYAELPLFSGARLLASAAGAAALVEGASEHENSVGRHLRVRRRLTALCPSLNLKRSAEPEGAELPGGAAVHPELAALADYFPHGALYLDLETCGFAGSMIFLVGLVWNCDGELWLDQLLARNYAEECAVLATLWKIVAPLGVLVTFNGKSFDWPMVNDRSTLHRLLPKPGSRRGNRPGGQAQASDELPADVELRGIVHCDLLHHARRLWRGRLPDCRLQTLERLVCRRHRSGDIPGAQVPRVYHGYVRSGDLGAIAPVLHHNALDLVTLVQIGAALLATAARAVPAPSACEKQSSWLAPQ
jgi:uncharacterized protein YprB with RNaseH-like and TPR domain